MLDEFELQILARDLDKGRLVQERSGKLLDCFPTDECSRYLVSSGYAPN